MKRIYVLLCPMFLFVLTAKTQTVKSFDLGSGQSVNGSLLYQDAFNVNISNWVLEKADGVDAKIGIVNQKLDVQSSGAATVWFKEKILGPVIIEYDATVVNLGGKYDRISDLNCYWMASDPENPTDFFTNTLGRQGDASKLTLYYTGFGGNNNSTNRFRRFDGIDNPLLPQHDLSDPKYLLAGNVVYHIKLVAYNNMIRYYINDQLIHDFYDERPYTSGYFTFRAVKNHMLLGDFKVYSIIEESCAFSIYPKVEAECFTTMSGIQTEDCTEGGLNVGYVNNGDWLAYTQLNLTGMISIAARYANKNISGVTMEVRLDNLAGALIATIPIASTGGNQNWKSIEVNLAAVTGLHDVYLVFKGGTGYLMNLNWLEFSNKIVTGFENTSEEYINVSIYPNPSSTAITIQNAAGTRFEILNASGETVLKGDAETDSQNVDLTGIPSGVYFVKIFDETSTKRVSKLIKK